MTDRTYYWHPLTNSYLHASEASVWDKICSQPPAICIAIERVRAAQVREIEHEGVKTALVALVGGLVLAGAVWLVSL